jgi:hypothetical protein
MDPLLISLKPQEVSDMDAPSLHLFFLIIVEALSKLMKESIENGALRGVRVSDTETVSHLGYEDGEGTTES